MPGPAYCICMCVTRPGCTTLSAAAYGRAIEKLRARDRGRHGDPDHHGIGGLFSAQAQMETVRATRPEAVSMALRELAPADDDRQGFADFIGWMMQAGIAPQIILYDRADSTGCCYGQRRARSIRQGCPFSMSSGATPPARPAILSSCWDFSAWRTRRSRLLDGLRLRSQ